MESRDIPCPALLYVSANPFPAGFSASIAAYFTWISPHQPIVPQHLFTFRYQNYLNSQLQPSPSLPIDLRETFDSYDLPISDLLLLAIAIAGSGALTPSSPAYPSKFQLQLQLGLVFRERISRDKGEILSFEVIKEQPGLWPQSNGVLWWRNGIPRSLLLEAGKVQKRGSGFNVDEGSLLNLELIHGSILPGSEDYSNLIEIVANDLMQNDFLVSSERIVNDFGLKNDGTLDSWEIAATKFRLDQALMSAFWRWVH